MKRVLLMYIFSILCISSIARNDINELQEKIQEIMRQYETIGLSMVVVKDNKILYSTSLGYNPDYINPEKRDSIKKKNVYYIASISKTFVGTAIMQLVEQGKLRLDDDVNQYLDFRVRNPYFSQIPITIRMLLSHQSSIKKGATYNSFAIFKSKQDKNIKQLFNNCKPGTAYDYSNLGYVLLGAVIEEVSGMRFDDYIDKNIITPMGLYGSYNVLKLDSNLFVRTYKYDRSKERFVKQGSTYKQDVISDKNYIKGYSTPSLRPAGGMMMSADDLAKYMIMHMNMGKALTGNRIISKESEQTMRKGQGIKKNIGLSFVRFSGTLPGKNLVGMTGGARGIHSAMLFQPEENFGFVVICNGCNSQNTDGFDMNKKIILELYNAFIKE